MTTTTMKTYDLQPTLDNPSLARIRFPAWLKSLYNVSQMELTTLDPLGAFYLVALDEDWDIRPENLNQQNQIRPRPSFSAPTMYNANAAGAVIATYNIRAAQFEYQQRVRADLHSAISRSLGSVTLQSINSKHRFGTGSLSPLDLVRELKTMFGTITKHEIDATQSAISAPLVLFANFRDFCSSMTQNYEFLTSCGHNIPELTRIDNFISSIQAWPQFDTYITTWRTNTALNLRTLASLQLYLLKQYGDMPGETAPRGGNAFHAKGKAKGKGKGKSKGKGDKGKGRGHGQKRTHDGNSVADSSDPTLSSFAHSASNSSPNAWSTGSSSNPVTSLTTPSMQDVNPAKPYNYCYFHGWNFTHKGLLCKKMRQAFDMDKLHAVNPTSTTPHGNASVEPAYKSWL